MECFFIEQNQNNLAQCSHFLSDFWRSARKAYEGEFSVDTSAAHSGKWFRVTWANGEASSSKTRSSNDPALQWPELTDLWFSGWSWHLLTAKHCMETSAKVITILSHGAVEICLRGQKKRSTILILKNKIKLIENKNRSHPSFICFFLEGTKETQFSTCECA